MPLWLWLAESAESRRLFDKEMLPFRSKHIRRREACGRTHVSAVEEVGPGLQIKINNINQDDDARIIGIAKVTAWYQYDPAKAELASESFASALSPAVVFLICLVKLRNNSAI